MLYDGLLRALPLLMVQTFGLAVILTAFWFFAGVARDRSALAVAGVAGALIAYAPVIAITALLVAPVGSHGLIGLASLLSGMALFTFKTLQARRLGALFALGPMLAFSAFTYMMLMAAGSGFI